MKKIIFLIVILSSVFINAQFNSPGSFDLDRAYEFKNQSNLNKAIVNVYEPQMDFHQLDSLTKMKFLEKQTTAIFDRGKIVEFNEIDNFNDKYLKSYETQIVKYDANNNLSEMFHHNNRTTYHYNIDSTEIITKEYHNWRKNERERVKYDDLTIYTIKDEKIIKAVNVGKYSKSERTYKYDYNGNEVYSKSHGVETKTKNTYDKKGKLIKAFITNNYGKKFLRIFTYDIHGKLISKKYFYNDLSKPESITKYIYDGDNLIQVDEISYPLNRTNSQVYTYDSSGNWITQKVLVDKIEKRIIERILFYN